MNLEPTLQQINDLPIAIAISESATLFPTLESIHVLALVLVFGTIAVVDLRLLGVRLHRASAQRLISELLPYTWVAFVVAVISGAFLFTSNAVQYGANPFFIVKMGLLILAGANMLVFHLTAHRRIAGWDDAVSPPAGARVAGFLSLALWTGVIVCGRWVGFTLSPF